MAKESFYNLPEKKRQTVYNALLKEFETHILSEASVTDIVKLAGISRGSFYVYFENLEESYFTVVETEVKGIQQLFLELMEREKGDFKKSLYLYGEVLIDKFYDRDKYELYKKIFSYWNNDLEIKLAEFQSNNVIINNDSYKEMVMSPEMNEAVDFIYENIENLVGKLFVEEWSPDVFRKKYNQFLYWLEHGIF